METTNDLLLEVMLGLSIKESIDVKKIRKKVLILSTPRSGSSMFCDVLANTEQVGECAEWFNNRYIAAYGKMMGSSNVQFNDYLTFIMEKTVGNTGIFAVNAHIEQMVFFAEKKINLLNLNFDVIVYISRNNKLAQAISLAKSRLTDSWSSDTKEDESKLEKLSNSLIVNSLKHIVDSESLYQEKLAQYTHAEFVYEDFSNLDKTTAYKELFDKIGVEYKGVLKTNMKRQSNSFSKNTLTSFENYILGK